MIDDRTRELIHAGLDGELDGAGERELAERLEHSAEARRYRERMAELAVAIDRLPASELPDELHRRIVSRIRLPAARSRRGSVRAWAPAFGRYGLAAAAGLLIAVGIYEFRPGTPSGQDLSGMSGTILPADRPAAVVIDEASFDDGQLSSALRLERRDGTLLVDISLQTRFPVEVSLDFTGGGEGLRFDGISQLQGTLDFIEVDDRVVHVQVNGGHHFAVSLRQDEARDFKPPSIRVDYSANGNLLNSQFLVLEPPE
jgi:negative regulator of sigma E activity